MPVGVLTGESPSSDQNEYLDCFVAISETSKTWTWNI